jgi:hypothetical protein
LRAFGAGCRLQIVGLRRGMYALPGYGGNLQSAIYNL